MVTIPLQKNRFNVIGTFELGTTYTFHTSYYIGKILIQNKKTLTGTLIKTGTKGFNFLNPKTNKCIFKRAVYQSKTSSPIKRNQLLFELKLPNWIQKITIGQCQRQEIEMSQIESNKPVVISEKKVNQIIGALYRMEL